jgi:hypothetical protein
LFDVQYYFKDKKLNVFPPMGFCFNSIVPYKCPPLSFGTNIQSPKTANEKMAEKA